MSHDTATLRQQLNTTFDDPALDAFCLDHFPDVYEKLSRGMRRNEQLTNGLSAAGQKSGL